jgi:hypothetical protein
MTQSKPTFEIGNSKSPLNTANPPLLIGRQAVDPGLVCAPQRPARSSRSMMQARSAAVTLPVAHGKDIDGAELSRCLARMVEERGPPFGLSRAAIMKKMSCRPVLSRGKCRPYGTSGPGFSSTAWRRSRAPAALAVPYEKCGPLSRVAFRKASRSACASHRPPRRPCLLFEDQREHHERQSRSDCARGAPAIRIG